MLLYDWITRFTPRITNAFPTSKARRSVKRAGGRYLSHRLQSIESLEERLLLTLTIQTTEEFRPLDTHYVVEFAGTGAFAGEAASFSGTATGTANFEYTSATSGTGTILGEGSGIGVDRFGPGEFLVNYDADVTINDNQLVTSEVVANMYLGRYDVHIPVHAFGPVAAGPYNVQQSAGAWNVLNAGATSHGNWDAIITQDITAPTDVSVEPLTPSDGLELETTISVTGKLINFGSSPGTPVGKVHLAWASGPTSADRLAGISIFPPIDIYWNTGSINLKIPDLWSVIPLLDDDVPDETTELQVYLELSPEVGDVDVTNNFTSVPLVSFIGLESVKFDDDDDGGVTVDYEILKDPPPEVAAAAKISTFWTTSAAQDATTGVRASNPIDISVAKGHHQFHILQGELNPVGTGSQYLKVAFDLGGGHYDIEALRLKAAPLIDLIAAVDGATQFDNFDWNPALDATDDVQGGFTFTYEVKAPPGVTQATFRNPFIEFYWGNGPHREDVIAGELAFKLKLTRDGGVPAGVEIRGTNTDLKAVGVHTIIVTHSALIKDHRSPTIDGTNSVAEDLMMVIDHPEGSPAYGAVFEMNDGNLLNDNNVSALKVVPLMLNVATHGWNSNGGEWAGLGYASDLTNIPVPDSVFDGRVKTILTNWDSGTFASWFGAAAGLVMASKILARSPIPGVPNGVSANMLGLAALVATQSRAQAQVAARDIAKDIEVELLSLSETNRIQQIHLIGHSRGGAVSAEVSRILSEAKYTNVSQLTVLDGFSTDWPDNGGLIGDFPIVGAVADRSVNYMVTAGLPAAAPSLIGIAIPEWVQTLLATEFGDLRAPLREGFENTLIGNPSDNPLIPTTHLNVHERYMHSDWLITDPDPMFLYPEVQQFIYDNVLGWNQFVGASMSDPALKKGEFLHDNATGPAPSIISPLITSAIDAAVRAATGFVDGTFEKLGELQEWFSHIDFSLTGDAYIDEWFGRLSQPNLVLGTSMRIAGDVSLHSEAAATGASNVVSTSAITQTPNDTSLRMVQTADTSLGQFVSFPENPLAIAFDLFVETAHPGDALNVYLGNALLQQFTLTELPAFGSYSIDISHLGLMSGDMTFRLEGPVADPSSIRLDNLEVTAVLNHAPVLADGELALPMLDLDLPAAPNPGRAVATLLDGMTDTDVADGRGLAIVGTNEIAGLVQYSLNDGATWNNVGVVGESGALLLSEDPGTRIRLLPNGGRAGDIADVVTFRAWDQTTGIAGLSGEYYDATVTGASSPFSAATDVISIHIASTADLTPPSSAVASLPATTNSPQLTVSWSGSDTAGGSGIATYSVFVSDNGGDYSPFVLNTVNTSAEFNGAIGHTYGFYSVATDNASNTEAAPAAADAVTTVIPGNQSPDILDAVFALLENSAIGSPVGTPVATDPDVGDTLTYSIIDGNTSGAFAIEPATGAITVANQAVLDFETTPAFNLSVQTIDNHGASDTANVTINLTDVNEIPQLTLGGTDVTWIKKRPPVNVLPQLTVGGTAALVGGNLTISLNVIGTAKKLLDQIHIPSFAALGSSPGAQVVNGNLTLEILLNAGATNASVESFLKAITFATKGKGLKAPTRTMNVSLATAGGETASVSQTIHVRKKA